MAVIERQDAEGDLVACQLDTPPGTDGFAYPFLSLNPGYLIFGNRHFDLENRGEEVAVIAVGTEDFEIGQMGSQ
jgi:hypothetical protein